MPSTPSQGEIWRVLLDPGQGAEMGKARPCVIVSSPNVGRLPLHIIVPITDWKSHYNRYPWMTKLIPSAQNGLSKISAADGYQVRSVSPLRFLDILGKVSHDDLLDIEASIQISIEVI